MNPGSARLCKGKHGRTRIKIYLYRSTLSGLFQHDSTDKPPIAPRQARVVRGFHAFFIFPCYIQKRHGNFFIHLYSNREGKTPGLMGEK